MLRLFCFLTDPALGSFEQTAEEDTSPMQTAEQEGHARPPVLTLASVLCYVAVVAPDSLGPHGLWPTRLLCPWDSLGKHTGAGCHFLLQASTLEPL